MRIVVLAGGIGGARFLRGLRSTLAEETNNPGSGIITVIGNTGDDITLFGLRICPDLDTVMYTLGGGINEEQGWGRAEETFTVREELAAYGMRPQWFGLGDRDVATHIVRAQMMAAGYPLSAVTEALCDRWRPGVRLLPMTDDRVETHVVVADGEGRRAIHFQEWWVRHRAAIPAEEIVSVGAADAKPAPGVLEAIEAADVVLLPPSNPVVSVGSILGVPGIRDAVAAKTVVGVSPIIGGAPVRGMADACLTAIGVATTAQAVAEHYGADLLDGWLVDDADAGTEVAGVAVRSRPLYMSDPEATAAIARAALDLAVELKEGRA
ncbi:2-phospho-L-lactate transferase [Marinitenerispora sediminis]|uniref:2-phospho-L-lactate transferase n=1 Tax=Marinitenerispora sediminis TaxID=1931232 RepID=A0A368T8Z0_9ACTN|nr:2-phospho-L-lactate transferase [Marinitenerispora sediminis]RCV55677.1 2-phospho-L-lactate transferase [Marinitenerispora sediminis]RCV57729.1 2-phospho-L-lactate transferase [Marinitenerispora sediminis]RCV60901.1 2-phospho-L-lactate transferase [Marinitenerispora sediminis]